MAKMGNFQHCSDYVLSRGYNTRPPTQDEIDFPIAYEGVINHYFLKFYILQRPGFITQNSRSLFILILVNLSDL